MYKGKVYNWMFTGDTETLLIKHCGDVVCQYKCRFPYYKQEITTEFVQQQLEQHLARPQGLTYEPFEG